MPYIESDTRPRFEYPLMRLLQIVSDDFTDGDLNYVLTRICDHWLVTHGVNYEHISDVVKALECAKLEFYRKVAVPYEDKKCRQNGEVYGSCL